MWLGRDIHAHAEPIALCQPLYRIIRANEAICQFQRGYLALTCRWQSAQSSYTSGNGFTLLAWHDVSAGKVKPKCSPLIQSIRVLLGRELSRLRTKRSPCLGGQREKQKEERGEQRRNASKLLKSLQKKSGLNQFSSSQNLFKTIKLNCVWI